MKCKVMTTSFAHESKNSLNTLNVVVDFPYNDRSICAHLHVCCVCIGPRHAFMQICYLFSHLKNAYICYTTDAERNVIIEVSLLILHPLHCSGIPLNVSTLFLCRWLYISLVLWFYVSRLIKMTNLFLIVLLSIILQHGYGLWCLDPMPPFAWFSLGWLYNTSQWHALHWAYSSVDSHSYAIFLYIPSRLWTTLAI